MSIEQEGRRLQSLGVRLELLSHPHEKGRLEDDAEPSCKEQIHRHIQKNRSEIQIVCSLLLAVLLFLR